MKINREVAKQALLTGEPLKNIVNRCVGKTAQAIFVDDPDTHVVRDQHWLLNEVQKVLLKNNLTAITAHRRHNGQVLITNTFAENLT